MSLVLHFVFGFSTSFLGMIFPSMLNMTTVKISLERGRSKANYFAIGVSTMVILQAYFSIALSEYIMRHPEVVELIQAMASLIFAGLAIYFYLAFKKDKKHTGKVKEDCRNTFLIGLLLSAVNMFAIPFYYGVTLFLGSLGLFQLTSAHIFLFALGSALGSFLILYAYPLFIKKINKNNGRKKINMNLILSLLTGALSLITLLKVL